MSIKSRLINEIVARTAAETGIIIVEENNEVDINVDAAPVHQSEVINGRDATGSANQPERLNATYQAAESEIVECKQEMAIEEDVPEN